MASKLTRREWAAALGSVALAAQPPPSTVPLPQNAEEELAAMREILKQYSNGIAKVEIPAGTEPAFRFKA